MNDAKEVLELLKDRHLCISSAESFTGGLFVKELSDVPGASIVLNGAAITYTQAAKAKVLGVSLKTILDFGVISKECAYEMAREVRRLFNSDIGVSFTGNAGPSASEDKPVGLCYIAIDSDKSTRLYELKLNGSREEIREKACHIMFDKLKTYIRDLFS